MERRNENQDLKRGTADATAWGRKAGWVQTGNVAQRRSWAGAGSSWLRLRRGPKRGPFRKANTCPWVSGTELRWESATGREANVTLLLPNSVPQTT